MIRIHLHPLDNAWKATVEGRETLWARGPSGELAFAALIVILRDELGIEVIVHNPSEQERRAARARQESQE